jgi:CrcB protein
MKLLWIGTGGALGSLARFLLDGWIQRRVPGVFPIGLLAVNALGSFAIGVIMTLLEGRPLDSTLRLGLTAGVLGGFTTYSSFNHQTLEFLGARQHWAGALNVIGTLATCLLAGSMGMKLGRWLVSAAG